LKLPEISSDVFGQTAVHFLLQFFALSIPSLPSLSNGLSQLAFAQYFLCTCAAPFSSARNGVSEDRLP